MKHREQPVELHDSFSAIDQAAAVLSEPLPDVEPALSREIARRSERIAQIFERCDNQLAKTG